MQQLEQLSTKNATLEDIYQVQWETPLGIGGFGSVYEATHRRTGQKVALKEISKQYTSNQAFQREMNALLILQRNGSHPHICSLHEHFDDSSQDHYHVILDLIQGGEMFDHLVSNGAFSERDASRMFREIASALSFLHGLGIVHGDLKPENIMLSSKTGSSAVIKIVDFGSAQTPDMDLAAEDKSFLGTVAYCPPEALDPRRAKPTMEPGRDLFAVGVILYIMLTGIHPFDLTGRSTDEEIEQAILAKEPLALRDSPITAHLSESSIELMERLMDPNPRTRMTADEMLQHPWVKGETASDDKMAFSDKKLSSYKRFQSKLEAKVFADIVQWSDDTETGPPDHHHHHGSDEEEHNHHHHGRHHGSNGGTDGDSSKALGRSKTTYGSTSLIERSFQAFDSEQKGYISPTDLEQHQSNHNVNTTNSNTSTTNTPATPSTSSSSSSMETPPLSLTEFSDLLAHSMKNRYFPKGHKIYEQGTQGDSMFFINSGVVQVSTKDGPKTTRGPGNYFGEGALLHPNQQRSASIVCQTPVVRTNRVQIVAAEYFDCMMVRILVSFSRPLLPPSCCLPIQHAFEVSRADFNRYLQGSSPELVLALKEKNKIRKKNRARAALLLHPDLEEREFACGQALFEPPATSTEEQGKDKDVAFLMEYGEVDVRIDGHLVLKAKPGNLCGEFTVISQRPVNATGVCVSEKGCIAQVMKGDDFRALMRSSPDIGESLRDLSYRRDFKKAVVKLLQSEFPYQDPRKAFDAVRNLSRPSSSNPQDGLSSQPASTKEDYLDSVAIGKLMRHLNPSYTDDEIDTIVSVLDLNDSGTVTYDEFKKVFIANLRTSSAM